MNFKTKQVFMLALFLCAVVREDGWSMEMSKKKDDKITKKLKKEKKKKLKEKSAKNSSLKENGLDVKKKKDKKKKEKKKEIKSYSEYKERTKLTFEVIENFIKDKNSTIDVNKIKEDEEIREIVEWLLWLFKHTVCQKKETSFKDSYIFSILSYMDKKDEFRNLVINWCKNDVNQTYFDVCYIFQQEAKKLNLR